MLKEIFRLLPMRFPFLPRLTLCLLLLATPMLTDAKAQEPVGVPLIVVRFNQPHVYFEPSLRTVVDKAISIKPDARFSLVQILPESANGRKIAISKSTADSHVAQVVAVLRGQGVDTRNLAVSRRYDTQVTSSEVHVFVE